MKAEHLHERSIILEGIDPVQILGVNNNKFKVLSSNFPKLKVVARGGTIKVIGDKKEIERFEGKLDILIEHLERYNELSQLDIQDLLGPEEKAHSKSHNGDVLVHGNDGLLVKARTPNQQKMVSSLEKNDMLFAVGPAGTGKTYTAVALAVRAMKNKSVRKIILTRPAVEAGENLGFLPGDLQEKLDPYLQPLYDALRDMIPSAKLRDLMEKGEIQIAPLAFMRGRTLDNAFVILDEAQNATIPQMKMFLTRMGRSAKFVITGDMTQVDLPAHQPSGLVQTIEMVKSIKGIASVQLTNKDVIRHKLVTRIIEAFSKLEDNDTQTKNNSKK